MQLVTDGFTLGNLSSNCFPDMTQEQLQPLNNLSVASTLQSSLLHGPTSGKLQQTYHHYCESVEVTMTWIMIRADISTKDSELLMFSFIFGLSKLCLNVSLKLSLNQKSMLEFGCQFCIPTLIYDCFSVSYMTILL